VVKPVVQVSLSQETSLKDLPKKVKQQTLLLVPPIKALYRFATVRGREAVSFEMNQTEWSLQLGLAPSHHEESTFQNADPNQPQNYRIFPFAKKQLHICSGCYTF